MKSYLDEEDDEQTNPLVDGIDVKNADEYEDVPIQNGEIDKQIEAELADYENNERMLSMQEPQVPSTPSDKYKDILQRFSKFKYNPEEFKKLQDQNLDTNRNLDMLSGANLITKGLVAGGGGNIGDNSEAINSMKKTAGMPVEQYKEGMKAQSSGYDLDYESEMNDPESDISKFARENAITKLKRLGFDDSKIAPLQNMTAKQLEKLGLSSPTKDLKGFSKDQYINAETGNPVVMDPVSGQYFDSVTRQPVASGKFIRNIVSSDIYGNKFFASPSGQGNVTVSSGTRANISPEKMDETAESFKPDEKQRGALDDEKKRIDGLVKVVNSQQNNIQTLINTLDANSKMSKGVAMNMLARASGEVGALTEADKAPFAGSQALLDRVSQFLDTQASSELTDSNKAEVKKVLGVYLKTIADTKTGVYDNAAQSLAQIHNIPPKFTKKAMGDVKPMNAKQEKLVEKVTQPMVRVVEVKTGKTGSMPKDQADKAIKSGKYQLEGQK